MASASCTKAPLHTCTLMYQLSTQSTENCFCLWPITRGLHQVVASLSVPEKAKCTAVAAAAVVAFLVQHFDGIRIGKVCYTSISWCIISMDFYLCTM